MLHWEWQDTIKAHHVEDNELFNADWPLLEAETVTLLDVTYTNSSALSISRPHRDITSLSFGQTRPTMNRWLVVGILYRSRIWEQNKTCHNNWDESAKCHIALFSICYTRGCHWCSLLSEVGLDWYRAGTRYPILSAAAIPIPILGCTIFFVLKMWLCAGV